MTDIAILGAGELGGSLAHVLAQRELAVEEERAARTAIEAAGGTVVELTPEARRAFAQAVQPFHD